MEKVIYIAGGCFWGVEAYYSSLEGVISTRVGYANGDIENPTYEQLKAHEASHAETLKITYDDNKISLTKLLEHYLRFVDPYSLDKQGSDAGHQYRSGVYYVNDEEEKIIKDYFDTHLRLHYKIEVLPLNNFYDAEEYHQDYLSKNPGGYCHINLNLVKEEEKKKEKFTFKSLTPLIGDVASLLSVTITLIFFILLKEYGNISEQYSRTVGKFYFQMVGPVTNWLPFSLTELFFVILIIVGVVLLVKLIIDFVKHRPIKAIKKITTIASTILSIFLIYTITFEFTYYRDPVDLPYYTEEVDNSLYKDIYNYFASDLNYCISQLEFNEDGDVSTELDVTEISTLVIDSYDIIDSDYFYRVDLKAKPMALASYIYREFQITGFTFAPFGEPTVNSLITSMELPLTIAHEIAHTKGVGREDDANQTAFYICLNSDNVYLRFSAYAIYFYQISMITSSTYMSKEDRQELISVDNAYYLCRSYVYNYWKKHDLLSNIGDWFNNLYITSSGVEEGTGSYNGGTNPPVVDPVTKKITANKYQQLFFEKYFRENS